MTNSGSAPFSPERLKAFVDAVVAIAMTLLILPLMESASEGAKEQAADPHFDTLRFVHEHAGQIWALVLSFVLIAVAWIGHHRTYEGVRRLTGALLWLNVAWMFMIVCLPVTTALVGSMTMDAAQQVVYIGNLILLQALSLGARVYLLAHPELLRVSTQSVRNGVVADSVVIVLFVIALVTGLLIPGIGYAALFLLILTAPLAAVINRRGGGEETKEIAAKESEGA